MGKILIVGLGGFLGSALRYGLSGWIHKVLDNPWYPYGTLAVNMLGCLFIGLLGGLADSREFFRPETRLFLLIGFLGGFTTFSTFSYETLALLRDAGIIAAAGNMAVQVFLGLILAYSGYAVSQLL